MILSTLGKWFRLTEAIQDADAERGELAQGSVAIAFAEIAHKVHHRLIPAAPEARQTVERTLVLQGLSALGALHEPETRSTDELREDLERRVSEVRYKLRRPSELRAKRAIRCAIPLLVGLASVVWGARALMAPRPNLLDGASWVASSAYRGETKTGTIATRPTKRMFFSTNREKEPWLVIDLKDPQKASELQVQNRTDCCDERPVPLVVEVSLDGTNYREIAREEHPFKVWNSSFPTTEVRYLRFRSLKKTLLHFHHVSLYAP